MLSTAARRIRAGSLARVLAVAPRCLSSDIKAGRHQTPIVDKLWQRRAEARKKQPPSEHVTDDASQALVPRRPEHSANAMTYAFASDEALRDTYCNPWGRVRVGRLLEDLDALAGTIAFEHCRNPGEPELLLVTASVDRIVYRHRANLKDDVTLSGRVTWVGRSSLEIGMRAVSSWTDEPFLEASFTFVARHPLTNRPAQVNPLEYDASNPADARAFELGAARDATRKALRKQAAASPNKVALDSDCLESANDLLGQAKPLLTMPSLADPHDILLAETKLHNALIAQPQQRNTAGRVFGGFLMRRAFELAHATAYLFGGAKPVFLELDQVTFNSPVSVGDLLRFESCVLYTSHAMDIDNRATMHVEVVAEVMRPEERTSVTSNVFNFTFGVQSGADGKARAVDGPDGMPELRRVLPATHEEAYRILERYKADLLQT